MDIRNLFIRLGVKTDKKGFSEAQQRMNSIKTSVGILAKGAAIAFAAVGASMGLMIKKAAEMEQFEISFMTILKSGEKVKWLMQELKQLTMDTPFKFEDTVAGAKNLLAVGVPLEKITSQLRMLGDLAAGSGGQLSTMVKVYRRVLAKGTAEMEALNMMTDQGIPILQKLADTMGVTSGQAMKMVEQRKVTADIFLSTLKRMTSQGGLYFNAMIAQSKSLVGLWSIFKDNISIVAMEVGKKFLPAVKGIVKSMLGWINANRKLIQTKLVEYFQKFVWFLESAWSAGKRLGAILTWIADLFGGWSTALKGLIALMTIYTTMQLIAIGIAAAPILKLIFVLGLLKVAWEDVYYSFAGGKNTLFNKLIEFYPWVGKVKQALGGLGKLIASAFAFLNNDSRELWTNLMIDGFREIGDAILSIFGTDGQSIADSIMGWIPKAKQMIIDFLSWTGKTASRIASGGIIGLMTDYAAGKVGDMFGGSTIKAPAVAAGGGQTTVSISMPMSFEQLPTTLNPEQAMSYMGDVVRKTLSEKVNDTYVSIKSSEVE